VIGINTAIATRSGGYEGIGFALPVNQMVRVYNNVIQYGRVKRGSIGVSWRKEDKPEVLKAAGLTGGVLVDTIVKGGPSDRAGLKQDDVIVAVNGKPIKDGDDLVGMVADTPVDSALTVTVDRAGKKMDMKVTVQDREEVFKDDPRFARRRQDTAIPEKVEGTPAKFGISIRPMADAEKDELKLGDGRGVLITRVEEASFAQEIGLQDRDVVVSINRQPVATPDDLKRIQNTLKPGDAVAFRVMRPKAAATRGAARPAPEYDSFLVAGTLPSGN
jgi:serine protease Do